MLQQQRAALQACVGKIHTYSLVLQVTSDTVSACMHCVPTTLSTLHMVCCCIAGLGALVARKDSLELLHKSYFGGGSVVDATGMPLS